MEFTDKNGTRWRDVVVCLCGFRSENIDLVRCPEDNQILGEISVKVPR